MRPVCEITILKKFAAQPKEKKLHKNNSIMQHTLENVEKYIERKYGNITILISTLPLLFKASNHNKRNWFIHSFTDQNYYWVKTFKNTEACGQTRVSTHTGSFLLPVQLASYYVFLSPPPSFPDLIWQLLFNVRNKRLFLKIKKF